MVSRRGPALGQQAPLPGGSVFGRPLGQVALVVPDVEASVRAYWDLLGIGPWRIYRVSGPPVTGVTYRGAPGVFAIRYALADVGGVTLEVIQPLEGPSIWHELLEARGACLHHIAFYVEDFEQATHLMRQAGWAAVQTGDGFGRTRDGRFAYFEHGDDIGGLVEIVVAPTERDTPELIYPQPNQG